MKDPAFKWHAFRFRNDPGSRGLWQKYQLSITPRFYGVLALLLALASFRNLINGNAAAIPAVWMTALVGSTALAGFFGKQLFPALARLASLGFIPLILWAYFYWTDAYPPPPLILLPLCVLFAVFADHVITSSLFLLFALGLLVHTGTRVPVLDPGQLELLLAFGITTCMLYATATVLWFLLHGLFTSRALLSEALTGSLSLRQTLLTIFFDKLSPQLVRLEQQFKRDAVSWPETARIAAEVRTTLNQTHEIATSLGSRFHVDPGHGEHELEGLRNRLCRLLLIAALSSCLFIVAIGLAGFIELRFPAVAATLALGALLWIDTRKPLDERNRLAAIYIMSTFIGMACTLNILEQRPPYQIVYFYIPVFCAAFVSGARHATVIALVAALFLGIWIYTLPPLEGTAMFMRSNIALALVFMLAFSHIVWRWFRQLLRELAADDNKLRHESETRYRLMATLSQDIANPLHVIQQNAEQALADASFEPNPALLGMLATRIRSIVAYTREFEEFETSGDPLPVEPVPLKGVFAELRAAHEHMLAAKNLVLTTDGGNPAVIAHGPILSTSVLSNLLNNAIQNSPRGGRIHIGTVLVADGWRRISIQDDSQGLAAKVQSDEQEIRLATLYLNRMNGRLVAGPGSGISVELPSASS